VLTPEQLRWADDDTQAACNLPCRRSPEGDQPAVPSGSMEGALVPSSRATGLVRLPWWAVRITKQKPVQRATQALLRSPLHFKLFVYLPPSKEGCGPENRLGRQRRLLRWLTAPKNFGDPLPRQVTMATALQSSLKCGGELRCRQVGFDR